MPCGRVIVAAKLLVGTRKWEQSFPETAARIRSSVALHSGSESYEGSVSRRHSSVFAVSRT